MKHIFLIFCLLFVPFLSISQKQKWKKISVSEDKIICNDSPWVSVFEDNFDGNALDISKWNPCVGVPRDAVYKYQKAWHKQENLIVENGLLKIVSKREQMDSMPVVTNWDPYTVQYDDFIYTSGEIWSKTPFTYGKLEARIKIPKGWGFCPAFWMYGYGGPMSSKKTNNEIDVFEFWNEKRPSRMHRVQHISIHYDGKHRHSIYIGNDFSEDFHIFTMIWEENKIEFYVDGILIRTDYKYKKRGKNIECQLYAGKKYRENKVFPADPMYIIVNNAVLVGKNAPNDTTPLPSYMEVDYVRFYQR